MDSIEVKGREYVKVSIAAERTGYTRDYIGQLCRKKQIDAKLVGRTWYVDLEALEKKKKDRTRSNFNKTQKAVQAQRSDDGEEAEKRHLSVVVPSYRRRLMEENIRYESDNTESLPSLQKGQPAIEEEFAPEPEDHQEPEDVTVVREEDAPIVEEEAEKVVAVRRVQEESKPVKDTRSTMDFVESARQKEGMKVAPVAAAAVPPSIARPAPSRPLEQSRGGGRVRRGVLRTALLVLVFTVSGLAAASMSAAWKFTPTQEEGYTQTSVQASYDFSPKDLVTSEMWHPRFLK